MNFLFQDPTNQVIETAYGLKEYGVLGIFSIVMLAVIFIMARHFLAMHNRNEARILELEKKMEEYYTNDRKQLTEVCIECRVEIQNSNEIKKQLLAKLDKI